MTIDTLYRHFLNHPSISTDTRTLKKGDIFFALKGENFDGNQYAEKAIELGASLAVVDDTAKIESSSNVYVCNSALNTMQDLAKHHRRSLTIPIIALTGSNGKTTTKELIGAVLKTKYNCLITEGNLNNHIGVPLTLLKLNQQHQIAVIEMGANHVGEIDVLCRIAEPDYGIITNIGKAHLEGFGSVDGIQKGKGELFDFVKGVGGTLFIYSDDKRIRNIADEYSKRIQYGMEPENDISGNACDSNQYLKVCYQHSGKLQQSIQTKLTGTYNTPNVLCAIAVGSYFDISSDNINSAIENYIPSNQRSQIIETESNLIVLDAYNANPSSMQVAIENLTLNFKKPTAVILGDMFELGETSKDEHQKIVDQIKSSNISNVILVGPHFYNTSYEDNFKVFEEITQVKDYLQNNPVKGYSILIKGSRGMKMESLLDLVK
ncbi:MAG TPA: UDP-N-acetylmuramoyl-tripeptide--D-alanyl-D-alanine ligase [Bacteroidia bacterium]|nr:UDP-N-acetylmuramoyl-tripeptide--D-alanyl-D-alanine ligase [Bacteroidia bacterium]HNT79277.1 UDP-N-acetylmuramoyl-tripeptide--D-alanyl-D-alanine ligase [Bacteroidia bacterium]